MFKSLMAKYYDGAYQRLLEKILSGTLVHIDETQVKLQNEKGYVWVFTNIEEVVYIYKPTREGGFLHDFLKIFRGVLVSDFYSAYDSIDCPQQKCLIHLIRDINQDLLNNPFDNDFKSIAQPFGALLRKIITTVDNHGLQKKYLLQHRKDIQIFFQLLETQNFDSDAAKALQERLTEYKDKLFTFIDYDGIPWNNNNAEHAIKQYAYYRENTSGMLRQVGLSDYLVLLSICQTCQYKGVSFLKFLLSKEQDVDVFCQHKQQRPQPSSIELYPKGFIPPHFNSKHKKKLHPDQSNAEISGEDDTGISSDLS